MQESNEENLLLLNIVLVPAQSIKAGQLLYLDSPDCIEFDISAVRGFRFGLSS